MLFKSWLLFVTTVFFASAAPGPNTFLALTHGIRYGVRRTVMTCLGLMSGLVLIMLCSVAGLGVLLATSEKLFLLVKYAGAFYLIYLGVKIWRTAPRALQTQSQDNQGQGSAWRMFRTGFGVALSNPKAFIFFSALFPQFIDVMLPQQGQLLILAVTFFLIEIGWQLAYAIGGARLTGWLNTTRRLKLVNQVTGGTFVGAGILLTAVSSRS